MPRSHVRHCSCFRRNNAPRAARDDGTFEGRGIYGQTLHIDRARRLVIVINSAAEHPTDRASGQARQAFIAAVNTELDNEKP